MSNNINIHSPQDRQPSLVGLDTAYCGDLNIFIMQIAKEEIWKCTYLEDLEVEIKGEIVHEVWKDIIGYEERYQVSNIGRVKSLVKRYFNKDRILKQTDDKGRAILALSDINKKEKKYHVSVLVAANFILNPENKPFVCHADDIALHNWASNLWWGTLQDNNADMCKKGRQNKGSDRYCAVINDDTVKTIKEKLKAGIKGSVIAKDLGISKGIVSGINTGRTWKHIN